MTLVTHKYLITVEWAGEIKGDFANFYFFLKSLFT